MNGLDVVCIIGGDVPLGHGRTLRIGVFCDGDGVVQEAVLAIGKGTGRAWKELPEEGGLELPPRAIEPLRETLGRILEHVQVPPWMEGNRNGDSVPQLRGMDPKRPTLRGL